MYDFESLKSIYLANCLEIKFAICFSSVYSNLVVSKRQITESRESFVGTL